MFGSIRWRIAILYSALMVAALGLLTVYLLSYVQAALLDNQREQSFRHAWLVAGTAEEHLRTYPDGRDLDDLAKALRPRAGERITFIRADGYVWGDSDQDPSLMDRHADRIEVQGVLQSGAGESIRESTTLGYSMLYVAVPIKRDGQLAGVARIANPMDGLAATSGHIQQTVALAGALVAVLSLLLGIYLARTITAPVLDLTRMTDQMAAGHLNQHAAVHSADEIGSLARSFNQMSERLRETIRAITRERNQTAAVLTHMVDGVIVVEPEGQVGLINPAAWRLIGRAPTDAAGRSFASVVRDHQLAELYEISRQADGAEQERTLEMGSPPRFVRAVAAGVPSERGPRVVLLLEDWTELRQAEAARRDFAANASHELRTPLASLRAVVETLEAGVDEPEMEREFLRRMHIELDRLTQMTAELIELSRIESGQAELRRRPTDLAQVARTAAEVLRPQAERAGLTLDVETGTELPTAEADPDRLQNVLINLIHNAIKFTSAGGSIVVRTFLQDGQAGISVSDTGVGIPAEELPRIFERFYKADHSRSGGGTGLGLSIAKHVVQAHGGRIWAESIEGRGSTFSFTIPSSAIPSPDPNTLTQR